MKIAIPVDETKNAVCVSFGRAPYFLFHDTESGASDLAVNPAAEAEGGAGPKAAQFIVDSEAAVVLTPRCGENAGNVLQAAEITVFKSVGTSIEENLTAFQEKKLEELTSFHAGFHGHQ